MIRLFFIPLIMICITTYTHAMEKWYDITPTARYKCVVRYSFFGEKGNASTWERDELPIATLKNIRSIVTDLLEVISKEKEKNMTSKANEVYVQEILGLYLQEILGISRVILDTCLVNMEKNACLANKGPAYQTINDDIYEIADDLNKLFKRDKQANMPDINLQNIEDFLKKYDSPKTEKLHIVKELYKMVGKIHANPIIWSELAPIYPSSHEETAEKLQLILDNLEFIFAQAAYSLRNYNSEKLDTDETNKKSTAALEYISSKLSTEFPNLTY